jgi:malonate decarboxylase beta subunit
MKIAQLLQRESFSELSARNRAHALLDAGSGTELVGPFDRISSPWLALQGIVAQSDDGVVVIKGTVDGMATLVLGIEGAFQGGSLGEVGGAKIAGALELAAADNRSGIATGAIILFETGGVRLQEANLGLAAIAEIHAAIVDLRRYQPVIGISAGPVGCFGGMSIAAALCSYLVLTREARLGLNGPAVIEQEAGIAEYDSRDKPFVWSFTGGQQRHDSHLVEALVDDDSAQMRTVLADFFKRGVPALHRSDMYPGFLARLADVDASVQATPEQVRSVYQAGFAGADVSAEVASASVPAVPATAAPASGRGALWFAHLTGAAAGSSKLLPGYAPSVLVADATLGGAPARFIAVVPDPDNRFPRARSGEVGLIEGWQLARAVLQLVARDKEKGNDKGNDNNVKTPIVCVVDVASQAYGRREEAYGIHQALAGAAGAYAEARLAGHPVIALIVGKAMSGAFLAHGYQANRLIAFDDQKVMVHAMGKESAARITLRSVESMEALASKIAPMAYDIASYGSLGLLWQTLALEHADGPSPKDLARVDACLQAALADIRADDNVDLRSRQGAGNRHASSKVRELLRAQWTLPSA